MKYKIYRLLLVCILWLPLSASAREKAKEHQIGPFKIYTAKLTNDLHRVSFVWQDMAGWKYWRCRLNVERDGQLALSTSLSCPRGKGDYRRVGLAVSREQANETSIEVEYRKTETKEDRKYTVKLSKIIPRAPTYKDPQQPLPQVQK
jgi:hypothetical protein